MLFVFCFQILDCVWIYIWDTLSLLKVFMGSFDIEQKEWENSQLLMSSSLNSCVARNACHLREGRYGRIEVSGATQPLGIRLSSKHGCVTAGLASACACVHLPAPYHPAAWAPSPLSTAPLAHWSPARWYPFASLALKERKQQKLSSCYTFSTSPLLVSEL